MSTDVKSMHMGQITSFFIPTVTLVGQNCSTQIPDRLKSLGGKKPLIVTDQGIVAVGILKQITDILDAAGMQYAVYDKTVPNPTDKNVEEATEAYKSNGCDSLITLGGGSSHDCGKGVGFVVGNGGTIHDYEGVDKSSKPFPPYVAVNTTVRYQPHQVQCRIILLGILTCRQKCFILKEYTIFNCLCDLCQFLINDTSGTHIHMTNF